MENHRKIEKHLAFTKQNNRLPNITFISSDITLLALLLCFLHSSHWDRYPEKRRPQPEHNTRRSRFEGMANVNESCKAYVSYEACIFESFELQSIKNPLGQPQHHILRIVYF